MPNLTISLSDKTTKRLRAVVRDRFNSEKGSLSKLIEESINEKLDAFDAASRIETLSFKAIKDNETIAEAENLSSLALRLKDLNINPRNVRVVSSRRLPDVRRAGFRGRRI